MAFSRFICWQSKTVQQIVETEALSVPTEAFLATHSPMSVSLLDDKNNVVQEGYFEEDLLSDFLSPEKSHVLLAVLGSSGSGKSHLVRWMSHRINKIFEKDSRKKIILIPRNRTNIRYVLEEMIRDLQGEPFDSFRNTLRIASVDVTIQKVRNDFLLELSKAVGPEGPNSKNVDSAAEDLGYVIENLRWLLTDPHFAEKYWLVDEGPLDRLARHIIGKYGEEFEEKNKRLEFSEKDLPSDVNDIPKASKKAKDFYTTLLASPELRVLTVDWLNRNLDVAIAGTLKTTGEDILQLFLEVRKTLAEREIEIILLIEDFARLQGIDRQLLEALLAKDEAERGTTLGTMRAVLALTTGYFESLPETVKTRIGFRVNVDRFLNPEEEKERLVDFASRYLRAARLPMEVLRKWMKDYQEDPYTKLKNVCEECPHQAICFSTFGENEGIGLYPFNRMALFVMLSRRGLNAEGYFNPRSFLRNVLQKILDGYRSDLESPNGFFPPASLVKHLDLPAVSTKLIEKLAELGFQGEKREVYRLVAQVWGNETGTLPNLSSDLYEAFGLAPVSVNSQPIDVIVTRPPTSIDSEAFPPKELQPLFNALDSWEQEELSQSVVGELRERVWNTLIEKVNWNENRLLVSHIKQIFPKDGVNFKNQSVTVPQRGVLLELPLNGVEFYQEAEALKGLLLYHHYGHWSFQDGGRYYMKTLSRLDAWAEKLLENTRSYDGRGGIAWDPVATSVKTLSICLDLLQIERGEDIASRIDRLFRPLPQPNGLEWSPSGSLSPSMKNLQSQLSSLVPSIQGLLKTRVLCAKGKSGNSQIVDPERLIFLLKQSSLDLPHLPEGNSFVSEYRDLVKAVSQLDQKMKTALKAQRELWLSQKRDLIKIEIPENFPDFVENLKVTINRALREALDLGELRDIENILGDLDYQELRRFLAFKEEDFDQVDLFLECLGKIDAGKIDKTVVAIKKIENGVRYLNESAEKKLNTYKKEAGGSPSEERMKIDRALEELVNISSWGVSL